MCNCKQKIFEVGDNPHKLQARLLRQSQASQAIMAVKNKSRELVDDPQKIKVLNIFMVNFTDQIAVLVRQSWTNY